MRIVICGAGTSGCVIAARLSEDPANEVVLLEVGPPLPPRRLAGRAHPLAPDHQGDPRLGYLARAGASPRIVHVPRGRVVGGLVGHQRRDRPARPPRALRRVGHAGGRLRLGELAALVPGDRGRPRLRRRALARRRGADRDRALPAPGLARAAGALRRGRAGRRARVGQRPQRPRGGRDRADPAQHGRRPAPDAGRPLPRPGARRAPTWRCAPGCSSTACGCAAIAPRRSR